MAYKINFSIPKEDKKIYEHLTSMKRNKSRYIVDLIKKDLGLIKDNNLKNIDENRINELIEDKLKEFMNIKVAPIDENLNEAVNKNDSDDDFM